MSLIITLRNISNLADISDYEYVVRVTTSPTTLKFIETGFVRGHKRADGWEELVRKLVTSREREIDNGDD